MAEYLPSETCSVVATIDPDAYTTSVTSGFIQTDVVDMANFRGLLTIVKVGEFGTSASLNVKLQESSSSNGTFTDITGKAITALYEGGSDDDKQALINLSSSEMTYRWARGYAVLTLGALDYDVTVLGFKPKFTDAVITTAYGDLSTVDEIVT